MRPATAQQLQTWSQGMKHQLTKYPAQTMMILGIAGGNGLEHIAPQDFQTVYGVDVNGAYLQVYAARYRHLQGILPCLQVNLQAPDNKLSQADLVIANLLMKYIGCQRFAAILQ